MERDAMHTLPDPRSLAVLGLAGAAALLLPAAASAEDLALDKIPPAVRRAANRILKGAKWSSAAKHADDGEVIYELMGEDANGASLSVEVSSDGKVVSVEREIDPKDLPKAASNVVSTKMPKFKIESALAIYGKNRQYHPQLNGGRG